MIYICIIINIIIMLQVLLVIENLIRMMLKLGLTMVLKHHYYNVRISYSLDYIWICTNWTCDTSSNCHNDCLYCGNEKTW